MNTALSCGAASGTCSPLMRRCIPLLVLVLFCLSVGVLALPSPVYASTGKTPAKTTVSAGKKAAAKAPASAVKKNAAKKKSSSKAVAKKSKKRTPYVRSLMPDEERTALRGRGISSGFGERAISKKRTRMHKGIDIPGPKDSKVIAFNDGEVIFVGVKNGYGKTVIVRQIDGREALYAHMNKYVVSMGDKIRRGDHIGHVGRTGRATGYHLHFEIIDDGQNLNPALHVWHGTELVLGPNDLNPDTPDQTRVAEPNKRQKVTLH